MLATTLFAFALVGTYRVAPPAAHGVRRVTVLRADGIDAVRVRNPFKLNPPPADSNSKERHGSGPWSRCALVYC